MIRACLVLAMILIACDDSTPIIPDTSTPFDGGHGGAGGESASASSSSVSSSSSSSSGASSGAGGSLPGGPINASGSRLKLYWYTSPDGLNVSRAGLTFDSLFMEDCMPYPTAAGMRCLPVQNAAYDYPLFADAACSQPATSAAKGCPKKHMVSFGASQCGEAPITVLRVLSMAPVQIAYQLSGNACVKISQSTLDTVDVYLVGPEVDYTLFAAMSMEHE